MYRQKIWKYYKQRTKYNNQSTVYNDMRYDSKFEAKVAQDFDLQIDAGLIKSYERQVKISLDVNKMHICNYYIDFVVMHNDNSLEYVEVKGYPTEVWRLKWKLFEALYKHKKNINLTVIKK